MKSNNNSDQGAGGFVCYKLPGREALSYNRIISFEKTGSFKTTEDVDFVFAPFDKNLHKSYLLKLEKCRPDEINLENIPTENIPDPTTKEDYHKAFVRVMALIDNNEFDKLVLSRVRAAEMDVNSVMDVVQKLAMRYPQAFVYGLGIPENGIWLGATPEILLTRSKDVIKTVALAGTRAISKLNAEVNWTAKEKREQQLIVDYLNEELERAGIRFSCSKSNTIQAGKMAHLKTIFRIENFDSLEDLLDIVHPGPAISGYPKEGAVNTLREIEDHDRSYYAGFLGPVYPNGDFKLFVNLRCMKLYNGKGLLYAGGGIVKGSQEDEEWMETELKTTTLLDVLGQNQTKQ